MLPDAFFEPGGDDDRFLATELTRGPWSIGHQHGGPPAALLLRAIERDGDDAAAWRVARFTIEILRPIPIAAVRVRKSVLRRGTKAQWLSADLTDDTGTLLASARALRMRRARIELPPAKDPPVAALPDPDRFAPFEFPFFPTSIGYHRAVEVRIARGRWSKDPTAAWMRPTAPLLRGEIDSALVRLLVVVDAANGVSVVLDPSRWAFVNPDLTAALWRDPIGEWVGLDTHATADRGGGGQCHTALHDVEGPIGHALQSLIIEARLP